MAIRHLGVAISPGRCATTSITKLLVACRVTAYHERLKETDTRPVDFFRAYDGERMTALAALPAVRDLLRELSEPDAPDTYVDTGWTLHPLIPLLANRFSDQLRILHIVRNPVLAAASMTLHGVYDDRTDADFRRAPVHIQPYSVGVFHPGVAARWSRMSPFERNLFRVSEIYRFSIELLERFPAVPQLVLRLEEFGTNTPADLVRFFGATHESSASLERTNRLRRWARGARSIGSEWRRFVHYPAIGELGEKLGYDLTPSAIPMLEPKMERYRRRGIIEHAAGAGYQIPMLRRFWRTRLGPYLSNRGHLSGTASNARTRE